MEPNEKRYGVRDRKNSIWLRKRVCERAGLIVREQSSRHLRFGWRAYLVEIPSDLPKFRAVQTALQFQQQRQLFRLSHVASGLMRHAGRNSFWRDHLPARFTTRLGS